MPRPLQQSSPAPIPGSFDSAAKSRQITALTDHKARSDMTLEERTKLYLRAAHGGGLATIGVMLAFAFAVPDFVRGLSIGLMIVPLVVMLIPRYRDEYIETLWQAGTSLSFAAAVLLFLVIPYTEGFVDGLIEGLSERTSGQDLPTDAFPFAAIAAFYIGFHWRWLRSRG